jgi:hypothetical protein
VTTKKIGTPEKRRWATKNYKEGPVSADVFSDGPTYRAILKAQNAKLLDLIWNDPARPGRQKDAAA